MTLTYSKLNDFDYSKGCFPIHACGIFCDGVNKSPILWHLQAEIVFGSDLPILDADKACCEMLGVKKLPGDVVVTLNKS